MSILKHFNWLLAGAALAALSATTAAGANFNIPASDLETALTTYTAQTGVPLIVSDEAVKGVRSRGASGDLTATAALTHILAGTGFVAEPHSAGSIAIVPAPVRHGGQQLNVEAVTRLAGTEPVHAAASVETVVVTSSKIKGDIQTVPIAITALSQEQLTSRQIAGGPDLVKEVPNLTFSKTNFTGYNIQIRGIGTQAISVTTDPAVAVAFNDTPFIRNHFFEQEFYDVGQVEVLRGPQGTLYGRNATAGVVNVISAKPTNQFEAMLSTDWGNYHNRRYEGMINIPVVDDRLDIRIAGEWTKRDGYSFNSLTNAPIDGRDLWSGRVTIGLKPVENLQMYLVWEHFQEDDDRIRSSKQLCKRDPGVSEIDGQSLGGSGGDIYSPLFYLSQGCLPTSLYGADAFQVPNGFALPYYGPLADLGTPIDSNIDPYASTTQSRNLRVIESALNPIYKAKNDIVELNADYKLSPSLTLSSQTSFNHDFLYSAEDYNRFNTAPGIFISPQIITDERVGLISDSGMYCDPQLGCSDRLVAEDLSDEHAWQAGQEFRLASDFAGPFNFSIGGNYLHYETEENYYVFINLLTLYAANYPFAGQNGGSDPQFAWVPGVSDNRECLMGYQGSPGYPSSIGEGGLNYGNPNSTNLDGCIYIDPNPISNLNNEGHNYFLSQNPYVLNSYAGFGEVYYNLLHDLKLTAGLRWTDDQKHFLQIPSWLIVPSSWGYPVEGVVDQKWNQLTGRLNATWTPKLNFTDQSLFYGSYAHGYKAGGANPPGAIFIGGSPTPVHPLTFKPEFVDAFELGTKNTLLDGGLTLNGDVFFYNYKGYQISEIVDRTSINLNFDATARGAELETSYEPIPGLKFNFAGGYEATRIRNGQSAVDLMDRTAGHAGWVVLRPFPTMASNCIMPSYVVLADPNLGGNTPSGGGGCYDAYVLHNDPLSGLPPQYDSNGVLIPPPPLTGEVPPAGYPGFDPATAPNNGAGFDKDLSGNQLPNAPHFTTSLSVDYTLPVSEDWAVTLHSDFYWQSQSFARVFNDRPYDKLRGYSNMNLALILTSASGWQVMGYLKNVFNTTAITGAFLNSDDSDLTTNVFLTDPRLFGVRVTKNW